MKCRASTLFSILILVLLTAFARGESGDKAAEDASSSSYSSALSRHGSPDSSDPTPEQIANLDQDTTPDVVPDTPQSPDAPPEKKDVSVSDADPDDDDFDLSQLAGDLDDTETDANPVEGPKPKTQSDDESDDDILNDIIQQTPEMVTKSETEAAPIEPEPEPKIQHDPVKLHTAAASEETDAIDDQYKDRVQKLKSQLEADSNMFEDARKDLSDWAETHKSSESLELRDIANLYHTAITKMQAKMKEDEAGIKEKTDLYEAMMEHQDALLKDTQMFFKSCAEAASQKEHAESAMQQKMKVLYESSEAHKLALVIEVLESIETAVKTTADHLSTQHSGKDAFATHVEVKGLSE